MITSWRAAFANPQAYFGFIQVTEETDLAWRLFAINIFTLIFSAHNQRQYCLQLSTWCDTPVDAIPQMRQAQLAATALPYVGYGVNADHGAGCK